MTHDRLALGLLPLLLLGTALPAHADTAAAADDASSELSEIVVLGFGQTRQVQSVDAAAIQTLTAGTSPIKAVQKVPGVNFQSADAFGAYEWSTRISLRGFNQNQLGFTLDGIPLGDMSYGNHNGLHVSRAIISDNIASIDVAQGSGAIGTASTGNLGGTLQFTSRNPGEVFGVAGSATYGSDDTMRGFVRLDTGDMTGEGLKGSLSYAYYTTDKWKGWGEQHQHQINGKLVQDLSNGGHISAFLNFSDRREQDYQDLSLDIIDRLGYRNDNIANDFELAVQIAEAYQNGTDFPEPYGTVDDVYFDAAGLRRDLIGGVNVNLPLSDIVTLDVTGYHHENHGQGIWFTPYVPSPSGVPISVRTTEYDIDRNGGIARITADFGANKLEVGSWIEHNSFNNARRFYGLDSMTASTRPTLKFMHDPFFTQWEGDYDTDTFLYYVSDRLDLGDLTLSGGWKGHRVVNKAKQVIGSFAAGKIDATDWFLPQVGIVYRVTEDAELFANATENMKAFVSAGTSGPFSTTQAGFEAIKDTLKPERSTTAEVGGRIRSGGFQGSLTGYYVDFKNRQLAFSNGSPIVGNPSVLNNVGKVRTYGFDLALNYRVTDALSLYGSYSYNSSTYRDDILAADGTTVLVPVKGKTVVDAPKTLLKGEIAYDDGAISARLGADYMSKRYFTYLNDQSVGERVIFDASIAYRFQEGSLKGFSLSASVNNLFDKTYISTVGSGGFGASGDRQTLLPGAPRQIFVTLKKDL